MVIAAACTLLALPAFAETIAEKTGINSTLGIAPTTKDFVQESAVIPRLCRGDSSRLGQYPASLMFLPVLVSNPRG
jgi:hypothetical protein